MRYALALGLVLLGYSQGFASPIMRKERANYCLSGSFFNNSDEYKIAKIAGKTRFIADSDTWVEDACPSEDVSKCPVRITTDMAKIDGESMLLVGKKYREFYCVKDVKHGNSGWVNEKDLVIAKPKEVFREDWPGKWVGIDVKAEIGIKTDADGVLYVTGYAQYEGAHETVHTAVLDFEAKPEGDKLISPEGEKVGCGAELIHLHSYVLVRDNGRCGVGSVLFDGLYERK